VKDLAKLTARMNRLRDESQSIARELLADHVGKSFEWVVTRKRRLDRIELELKRLEARFR
jgi:hypothetical protein